MHGRFNHSEGLLPAVTSVAGTRLCGVHAEEALWEARAQKAMMDADIASHEVTILDSPALAEDAR
jgi:hypothetical protein